MITIITLGLAMIPPLAIVLAYRWLPHAPAVTIPARSDDRSGRVPPIRQRLLAAAVIGIVSGAVCYGWVTQRHPPAGDFRWPQAGALFLAAGGNPYGAEFADTMYKGWPLYYPLPALFVAAPFALLPAPFGAALFFGLSSALLAYALTRDRWWPLLLFVAAPYWSGIRFAQWAPLMTATLLLPALLPLAICKPNIGLPVLLSRPSRAGLAGLALILALSLVILPTWPLDMWRNTARHQNYTPLLTFPGPLLLLALVRWRDWRARLLLALSVLPQGANDPLPLFVLARTPVEAALAAALSWIGLLGWHEQNRVLMFDGAPRWYVWWVYLPALAIVLRPDATRLLATIRARSALRQRASNRNE
jgi:hypothetical protein